MFTALTKRTIRTSMSAWLSGLSVRSKKERKLPTELPAGTVETVISHNISHLGGRSLGRVVRTTAFKLSAIYFAVFSLFAIVFIAYIAYSTNVVLGQQLRDTIAEEVRGLADVGRSGGLLEIVDTIEER